MEPLVITENSIKITNLNLVIKLGLILLLHHIITICAIRHCLKKKNIYIM